MSDQRLDYRKAILDPESVFGEPETVLDEADLATEQKIEILRRWIHDANEIAVAENEGMVSDQPLILRRVLLALEKLTHPAAHKINTVGQKQ